LIEPVQEKEMGEEELNIEEHMAKKWENRVCGTRIQHR
jgi:hypothetical protein